jgi:hypothetical protein
MEATTAKAPVEPAKPQAGSTIAKDKLLDFAFQTLLKPLTQSLDRIEKKLSANGAPTHEPAGQVDEAILAPVSDVAFAPLAEKLSQLGAELADFRHEVLTLLQSQPPAPVVPEIVAAEVLAPVAPQLEQLDDAPHDDDSWEEIILGSELSGDAELNVVRQQFLRDVIGGATEARALAGQLLLLQATPKDELPERFRHVGEAYYRWRPRSSTTADPLEQALASWLTKKAEDAGLRNSIALVRPGDRFDSTRHSAPTRGVEVAAVHGWIVLFDNTKVYTKASVTVK